MFPGTIMSTQEEDYEPGILKEYERLYSDAKKWSTDELIVSSGGSKNNEDESLKFDNDSQSKQ